MKIKLFLITVIFFLLSFSAYAFGKTIADAKENVHPWLSHIAGLIYQGEVIEPQTPVRLIIPELSVNAPVELVGETADKAMDVPKSEDNVGWWKYGAKPGETGSAVIAGHIDRKSGGPAVFFELDKLNEGDEIEVIDENDMHFIFKVVNKKIYKNSEFPIDEVFSGKNGSLLNLITCVGFYDQKVQDYNERLVIYTQLDRHFGS